MVDQNISMEYDKEIDYNNNDYNEENLYPEEDFDAGSLTVQREMSYTILKVDDLDKSRNKIIQDIMEFTSLNREDAIIVLIYFKWNTEKIRYSWYDDPELPIKCGLDLSAQAKEKLEKIDKKRVKTKSNESTNKCRICDDQILSKTDFSLKCGHQILR